MMRLDRLRCLVWITASVTAIAIGCRETDAPPSHNRDLGTEDTILLPTASAWVDPAVSEGRADWRPLREPNFDADAGGDAEAPPAGGNAATVVGADRIEADIRAMLDEYHALLDGGKYEDIAEFFVEGQDAVVVELTRTLPALAEKLRELNAALPQKDPRLDALPEALALNRSLRVEVETIQIESKEKAGATLKTSSSVFASPTAPAQPDATSEVRFVYDGEEEYWLIDIPSLTALQQALPMMAQSVAGIDQLVAGIKSGEVSGDVVAQQISAITQAMSRLQGGAPGADEPNAAKGQSDARPAEAGDKTHSPESDESSGGSKGD